MKRPSSDSSIRHEGFDFVPPSGDRVADEPALSGPRRPLTERETAENNVWDEPSLQAAGVSAPPHAFTYAKWYRKQLACTTPAVSWGVTLLAAAIGGVFAVGGTLFEGRDVAGLPGLVILGPLLEEMLKIGVALILLENRPYLFRSSIQILIVVIAAALTFAAIENVLYIHVYFPKNDEAYRAWRWIVCTALHVSASTTAGIGLVRMWRNAQAAYDGEVLVRDYSKPRTPHAYPFIVAAVILHGTHNLLAVLFYR